MYFFYINNTAKGNTSLMLNKLLLYKDTKTKKYHICKMFQSVKQVAIALNCCCNMYLH